MLGSRYPARFASVTSPRRPVALEITGTKVTLKGGTVRSFEGDLDAYRADLLAERGQRARAQREESGAAAQPKAARADQRREAAARRAETAPLRRAVQAAEKELERLTAKRDEIDAALAKGPRRGPAKAADDMVEEDEAA